MLPRRLFAATLIGSNAIAQPSPSAALQARLAQVPSSYLADHWFMGTVLLSEGDHVLLSRGYGQANLDWQINNSPDVKFRIGSLTKQFTSALILMLQQDGKLSITEPVTKYLPSAPVAWSKITLAQLLGHVSGIANFTDDPAFSAWSASPRSETEELAFIESKPLTDEPGSKFSYSNSNYEVLGAVIERVSGKSYGEVLRQRILEPLGMHDTGLDSDELILPERAQGYQPSRHGNGLEQARSESLSIPWAAGSIYSTTGDLLRWERGLFGGKVLTPASLKLMLTPGRGDYGLGLIIQTLNGTKVVWHDGGIEGFTSYLAFVPNRQITAIVLSNVGGPAPDLMGKQMIDLMLGKEVILPGDRKHVSMTLNRLSAYVGHYFSPAISDFDLYISGNQLNIRRKAGGPHSMFFEGIRGGHALFYVPDRLYELEFVPSPTGSVKSVILHFAGNDVTAERR